MIKKTTITCISVALLIAACGGARQQESVAGSAERVAALSRGRALLRAGNYMVACPYLEASLSQGEDEAVVLPLLAGAQIRSGRLLAARQTMKRLIDISPEHPHAEELMLLLNRLLVSTVIKSQKEHRQ